MVLKHICCTHIVTDMYITINNFTGASTPSLSLTLPHMHSPALPHSISLTLHHSPSLHLTLPHSHSPSLSLTLPSSLFLTLPHSPSLFLTLPHSPSQMFGDTVRASLAVSEGEGSRSGQHFRLPHLPHTTHPFTPSLLHHHTHPLTPSPSPPHCSPLLRSSLPPAMHRGFRTFHPHTPPHPLLIHFLHLSSLPNSLPQTDTVDEHVS